MATIDDFGGVGDPLGTPKLGGTDGWAAAVRDAIIDLGVSAVPAGGTTGQVLAKGTATDFDTEWIDPPAGAGSGLVASGSFTAQASFSVDGCFTSASDDYRIVLTFTAGSTDGREPLLRLRASSTDAAGSADYVHGTILWANTYGPTKSVSKTSSVYLNAFNAGGNSRTLLDVTGPALATATGYDVNSFANLASADAFTLYTSGMHLLSTAYDGFTVYLASGTMSGTYRVYSL